MPLYDYECKKHGIFDDYKSIRDYKKPAKCPKCGKLSPRILTFRGHFTGTAVESPEYNPGLGCIVKNKKHRQEICRRRGLEEIGNERPERVRKYYDDFREERRAKKRLSDNDIAHLAESIRSKKGRRK